MTHIDADSLIEELRLRAKEVGMTELSRRAGIARAHLYQCLVYDKRPTIDTLFKIASALNLALCTVELNKPWQTDPKP